MSQARGRRHRSQPATPPEHGLSASPRHERQTPRQTRRTQRERGRDEDQTRAGAQSGATAVGVRCQRGWGPGPARRVSSVIVRQRKGSMACGHQTAGSGTVNGSYDAFMVRTGILSRENVGWFRLRLLEVGNHVSDPRPGFGLKVPVKC